MNPEKIIALLHREVKPALGCTEPIAVALAVSKAVEIISDNCASRCPEGWRLTADFRIDVAVSGNILKNGMGVGIPGTGRVGLPVAAALGAVCGDSRRNLEVLADVTDVAVKRALELVEGQKVTISVADTDHLLYVKATVCANGQAQASAEVNPQAYAIIEDDHDRIVETCFADRILMSSESAAGLSEADEGEETPSVREILDFANNAPFADIAFILEDRTLNLALAREGLAGDYGMSVGKTIRENQQEVFGDDFLSFAMGLTAAASDARMAGSTLPAMSNSGSGNQGITSSMPVLEYAEYLRVDHETLVRAVVLSDLTAVHAKRFIGELSAFCGAVTAAAGTGAAICYMRGGSFAQYQATIANTLANVGGIVCDGAKPSCAAKIAAAVDAAILGCDMALANVDFRPGEGLVGDSAEDTIRSMGYVGRVGMHPTDVKILNIMIGKTVCS